MSTPEFDPSKVDHRFVKDLEKAVDKAAAEKDAKKKDKEFEDQVAKAATFVKSTTALLQLVSPFSAGLSADDRQKLLEDSLTGLIGSLLGEGGDDLADAVHDLMDIARGKLTDDEKQKKLEASIKKLLTKAGVAASGAKDKEVGQLVDGVVALVKLATGSLSDGDRQKLLNDQALKLIASDLIKRQLQWFVTENFMTYFQAVKLGYELGQPFGDAIAKQLAPIVKARYGEDFLIALESQHPGWFDDVAAGHAAVTVTLQGSFNGWQGTAFWDYTVNDVRIQVITPANTVLLLDGNGVDVTNEKPGSAATDESPPADTGGAITDAAQSRVIRAMDIANRDPKVKDLTAKVKELHDKALATERRAVDAQRKGDTAAYQRLEIQYRMEYSEYWRIREQYKAAVHAWLVKAATAERWGTIELNYLWRHEQWRIFAVHEDEIPQALALPGMGRVAYAPRALGRGVIGRMQTLALAVTALLAFGVGFLLTGTGRGPSDVASVGSEPPTIGPISETSAPTEAASIAPAATGTHAAIIFSGISPSDSVQFDTCTSPTGDTYQTPHNVYTTLIQMVIFGEGGTPPPSLTSQVIGKTAHITIAGGWDAGTYSATIAVYGSLVEARFDGKPCPMGIPATKADLTVDGFDVQDNGSYFEADIPWP